MTQAQELFFESKRKFLDLKTNKNGDKHEWLRIEMLLQKAHLLLKLVSVFKFVNCA